MGNNFYPVIEITGQLLSANSLKNCLIHGFNATSTILGQEVAECVLEVVHVRAGYILGIMFVLLIKKYFVLSYFIQFI